MQVDKTNLTSPDVSLKIEYDKSFPMSCTYDPADLAITHEYDKSNKSKQYQTVFFLKNTKKANDPHIRVECTVWSSEVKEQAGFSDTLNVVAMTTEILDWIYSGYK